MILKDSKQWELVGLASFTKRGATSQSGSGYTLIAPLLQFIQNHINEAYIHPTILNCSCQCPRGVDSGYALSRVNSLDGCLDACMSESANPCTNSNTYTCLETSCTYSSSYNATTISSARDQQPFLGT